MRVLIEFNTSWQYSEDEIYGILKNASALGVTVNSVDRALFSGRFEVQAETVLSQQQVQQIFYNLLDQAGYSNFEIKFEGSSGGLAVIGDIGNAIKWPIVVIVVIALLLLFMLMREGKLISI